MKVFNRKYKREFEEVERMEAGIVLSGGEAKSVRAGRIIIDDAFAKLLGNEAFLINAEIPLYEYALPTGYDSKRTRKLLLHKKELLRLKTKILSGGNLTIVPIVCYNKHDKVKIEIGLVKGRKDVEKRKYDKQKDIKRNQQIEAKEYMKV